MRKRIERIRKDAGLSQEKFAKRLGMSRSFFNQVETGKNNVSDRTITDICREFDVNETWLRTGEGDPYIKQEREDQLTAAVNRLLSGENPEFCRRLVMVLSTLDDEQWGFLEAKMLEIVGDRQTPAPVPSEPPEQAETPETEADAVPLSEAEIEEQVAAYRALLKKGQAVRLALGHGSPTPPPSPSGTSSGEETA